MTIDRELEPHETELAGSWTRTGAGVSSDDVERRIEWLVSFRLVRISSDVSGWDTIYQDPRDNRFWELDYPSSETHGGGPQRLRTITPDAAASKYGLTQAFTATMLVRSCFELRDRGPVLTGDLLDGNVRPGMLTPIIDLETGKHRLAVAAVDFVDQPENDESRLALRFDPVTSCRDLERAFPVATRLVLGPMVLGSVPSNIGVKLTGGLRQQDDAG